MKSTLRSHIRSAIDCVRFGPRYASIRFARNYSNGKVFEDYRGNLPKTLQRVANLRDQAVADVGTGTGQIPARLAGVCTHIYAFDRSSAMVQYALEHHSDSENVTYAVADARHIPLPESMVEVVLYPWSLLSILAPHWGTNWHSVLTKVLSEATRILRRNGTIAIIETLNINGELPPDEVWHPIRREFLRHLECDLGFEKTLFANDWDFVDVKHLRRYGPMWFDRSTIRTLGRSGQTVLRENAGVWSRCVSD